jgi:hypothetical protein
MKIVPLSPQHAEHLRQEESWRLRVQAIERQHQWETRVKQSLALLIFAVCLAAWLLF